MSGAESEEGLRVRATLTLRNEKMLAAREALGLSQIRLAKAAEVSLEAVGRLERMQFRRFRSGSEAVARIALVLDLEPDEVLPPGAERDVPNKFVSVGVVPTERLLEFAEAHQSRMLLPSPDQAAEAEEVRDAIEAALQHLTFREREIIKLRYGIGDGYTYTLEEVGHIFKVTRERVRTIETKALEKLRHPTRWRGFQEMLQRAQALQAEAASNEPPPPFTPEEEREILCARSIDEIPFGMRVRRALRQLKVHTIGDLTRLTVESFFVCHNFGEESMGEVCGALKERGLSLQESKKQ